LDKIDPKDAEAQKDLVINALESWNGSDKSKIIVKDISGMGGSRTYMISCPGNDPECIILHNKSFDTNDTSCKEREFRQEKIVKALSDTKATPGRIVEGDTWYIEPCAGVPVQIRNSPEKEEELNKIVEKASNCLARIHSSDTLWFDSYREKGLIDHINLKLVKKGSQFFYVLAHSDLSKLIDETWIPGYMSNDIEPHSEIGRRIVTTHGDWHGGNILDQKDGTFIAID